MDWTQKLIIILIIGAVTTAVWHVSREDMKLVREGMKRHDEESSKKDALWANLLEKIYKIEQQIYAIKLDQSGKS